MDIVFENLRMEDQETDFFPSDPLEEMKNSTIETMIQREVDKVTEMKVNTNRMLELLILVPCSVNEHIPKIGGSGYFVIRGNKLMDISRSQLGEKAEHLLMHKRYWR